MNTLNQLQPWNKKQHVVVVVVGGAGGAAAAAGGGGVAPPGQPNKNKLERRSEHIQSAEAMEQGTWGSLTKKKLEGARGEGAAPPPK